MWRALILLPAELSLGIIGFAAWATAPSCLTRTASSVGAAVADGSQITCSYVAAHVALPGVTGLLIATLVALHLTATVRAGLHVLRQTRRTVPSTALPTPDRLAIRADRLGIAVRVVDGPAGLCHTTGLTRPTLIISNGTLSRIDDTELDAVLEHEATHVRQRHPLQTLIAHALLTPLRPVRWTQPLLHSCRLEAELQADAAAIHRHGVRPLASALLKLSSPPAPHTSAPITGATSMLPGRVAHLSDSDATPSSTTTARRTVAVAAVVVATVALTAVPVTSEVEPDRSLPATTATA
jgi:beta-lactamase regulating signal transducer with metallopeptidase domain